MKRGVMLKVVVALLTICLLLEQIIVYAVQPVSDTIQSVSVEQSFPDIKGHWAQNVIEKFGKKGWIEGYDDGLFRPDREISRAEFTAIVIRILNKLDSKAECSFLDVEKNAWFYRAVASSVNEKYIVGYPGGLFKPANPISRQEVAAFSQKLLKVDPFAGGTIVKFADEAKFPAWSAYSIKALASHEIINGYKDGEFKPEKLATRAEAVKMLDIILKKLNIIEPTEPFPGMPGVTPVPTMTSLPTATSTQPSATQSTATQGSYPVSYQALPTPMPTRAPIVDIECRKVDLTGSTTDPQTLKINGNVKVEIANNGPDEIKNKYEVVVFEDINLNKAYDISDNILGRTEVKDAINVGSSLKVSMDVNGTVQFKGTIVYAFVDSKNQIQETNETNNLKHNSSECEYKPPVGSFNPMLKWKWDASSVLPNSLNVMMTPVIMDINEDDVPDVVFGSTDSTSGKYVEVGVLRAISGDSGKEIFSITDSVYNINTASSIAAADIDNDGKPEIIACDSTGARLIAFENDGSFKWRSADLETINWGSPCIADIDSDGKTEIIIGRQVLNNDGTIRWEGKCGKAEGSAGPLSFAADINMDGKQEIICGNTVYNYDGSVYWQNTSLPDGHNAIANFDEDSYPEIVLVHGGKVWLLEDDGTIKWGPVSIPEGGHGGPPTVADFDHNGKVEIGVAGASRYTVFNGDGTVLWSSQTQDLSSNVTGSSVFDFEGDGAYEVVYRDEKNLRIYRGLDGKVLFETPMSSCTWYEYVLVVDVDSDGNAEIVAVANNNCGNGTQRGVYVFGDENDTWVNTCKVWNQHAYSITNINSDSTVLANPVKNWGLFNNFRCNQSIDALACVDLTASYLRVKSIDNKESYTLTARIGNGGALYAPKGVRVAFYDGDPKDGGVLIGTAIIENKINPGQFEEINLPLTKKLTGKHVFKVVADDDGLSDGMVREINENNNEVSLEYEFDTQLASTPTVTPTTAVTPTPTVTPTPLADIKKDVTASEALKLINDQAGRGLIIIDVRTSEEYAGGYIKDAVNIDCKSDDFKDKINALNKDGVYLVYCGSGVRSSSSVDIMEEMGFKEVYNLIDGLSKWQDEGYPVDISK